ASGTNCAPRVVVAPIEKLHADGLVVGTGGFAGHETPSGVVQPANAEPVGAAPAVSGLTRGVSVTHVPATNGSVQPAPFGVQTTPPGSILTDPLPVTATVSC